MKKFYQILIILLAFTPFASLGQDSCTANYTASNTNSLLTKKFTALPWHNHQKPVQEVCWKFGDGTDTCLVGAPGVVPPLMVEHHYPQVGLYTVCVKIKYDGGCISEKCGPVQVGATTQPDSCRADFSVAAGTVFNAKIFTPLPWHNNQKPVTEVRWQFGDGTAAVFTSTATPVTHLYNAPGTYNVCIRIKYDGGCVSEKCIPVVVMSTTQPDSCRADFSVATGSVFNAKIFTPIPWHNNQKPVTEIRWTFGDGSPTVTTTTVTPVTHVYNVAGTYNVCIRIQYDGGCVSEKCIPVTVTGNTQPDSCRADFTVIAGTVFNARIFTPIPWHNHQKPVTEIRWNFGDGSALVTTTTVTPVTHLYNAPGTYNVCIRIQYDGGCVSEKCIPVVVVANTQPDSCSADYTVVAAGTTPGGRLFTPITWHNHQKPVTSIRWDFGDGSPFVTTTTVTPVTHFYPISATYNVCIRITYDGGCVSEKCHPLVIQNNADSCGAGFQALQTSATTYTRTFVATPWHNNNKPPIQICWNFGDGPDTCISAIAGTTVPMTITHTYAQAGAYHVCVKIKYDGGCISQYCNQVGITTPADSCTADFESSNLASVINGKKFTAIPWHNNGKKPERVCWQFGDGHDTCITYNPSNASNIYSVIHVYAQPGVYNVCVKIKYQGGCESQKCRQVAIGQNTPVDSCNAYFNEEPIQNTLLMRKFTAVPWHSNNKKPEQVCWKFGDGHDTCISYNPAVSTLYSVTHQYAQPGVYTVCVRIKYQGGCESQYCRTITIVASPCRALFTDSMISRFKVKFKGQAIIAQPNNPVVSWQWTFGDGTSGTGQNVIHEFPHPGTYNVCLKITTANGCQAMECHTKVIDSGVHILQLYPNPVVNTLYITYYSYHNETAQVKIYNTFGIVVRSFTRQMTVGYNNFSTDVSTLPTSPYSLVVQTPTTTAASVFFKQ